MKTLTLTLTLCVALCIPGVQQALCLAETDMAELAKSPAGKKHAYGKDPLQFGELVMPSGPGRHPVVIFIHGGCWLSSYDINHSRSLANALAGNGMAVWNLEYRRIGDPGGGWPGTFLDVARGADHLRVLAKKYPLDLSRIIAVGHSAGGHLALWLVARQKIPTASELYRAQPIAISAVLSLAPAPELDRLYQQGVCGRVIDKLIGGSPEAFPERFQHASPSRWAPLGVPQVVILGEKDRAWSWVGEAYVEIARKAGDKQIELVKAPDAGHFEFIDPKSSTWPIVLAAARRLLDS